MRRCAFDPLWVQSEYAICGGVESVLRFSIVGVLAGEFHVSDGCKCYVAT